MSLAYVRKRYAVPAKRGARVEYEGHPAVVTSARNGRIRLRFDGESRTDPSPFHPTWHINWLAADQGEGDR